MDNYATQSTAQITEQSYRTNCKVSSPKPLATRQFLVREEVLWQKQCAKYASRLMRNRRTAKYTNNYSHILEEQAGFNNREQSRKGRNVYDAFQSKCVCGVKYHEREDPHDCHAVGCHRVAFPNPFAHGVSDFEVWAASRMWWDFEQRHFIDGDSFVYDPFTYTQGQYDVICYIIHCQFPRRKYYRVASFGSRYLITRVHREKDPNLVYLDKGGFELKTIDAQWGFDLTHKIDLSGASELIEGICSKFDIFNPNLDWKTIVASAILCLTNVWYNWDRPATIFLAVSQFLLTLKLAQSVIDQLAKILYDYYSRAHEVIASMFGKKKPSHTLLIDGLDIPHVLEGQAASPLDYSPLVKLIGGAASTLLCVVAMGYLPGGEKFDTTFNRYAKLSGVIRSYDEVSKVGTATFDAVWDTVAHRMFGMERTDLDEWKNIDLWITEVRSLLVPDFENNIKGNESMKQQVESLITRGMNVIRLLDMLKTPMTERQTVNQCMMFLMRARETAGSCGAGQTKPRVAPAIIHFYGDSGVGKSTTLWALIAELQAALGVTKPSDLHEKTYFRRPGGKHWDGYNNGINVTVCDDFGAMKDTPMKPNEEFLEAIHMSNTAFWQLNMAELSDKRGTHFQSKVVLWTSNKSHFDVQSLTNPEAVLRRVGLKIRQKPHPNFARSDIQGGKQVMILDGAKVSKAIQVHGKSAVFGCLLFDIIDRNSPNDEVLESDLTFEQIAGRCVDLMKKTINEFEVFNEYLGDYIVDAIARNKDGCWRPPIRDGFDPNLFVVDAQWGFKDLKNFMGLNNVHVDMNDGVQAKQIAIVHLGKVSDEDRHRLEGLNKSECFFMRADQESDFRNCYDSAEQAYFYGDDQAQNDDGFLNYFVQAEKYFGVRFELPVRHACARCGMKERTVRISKYLGTTLESLNVFTQNKFGMSPSKFGLVVTGATIAFGLVSTILYKKIFKRIRGIEQESYDTDRTKAQKAVRIAETAGYSTDVTKGRKTLTVAEHARVKASSRTGGNSKLVHDNKCTCVKCESYDQKPVSRKTIRTEGWFFSSPCAKHGVASGFCQECDNACAGGHGNLKDFCFICDPDWFSRLGCEAKRKLHAQAIVDQNAAEVVNVVYRNMYKLECLMDDKWEHIVNILIVKGRLAILNRHVLSKLSEYPRWRIRNQNFLDGIEIDIVNCRMFYAPDDDTTAFGYRDVMMLELPRLVHQHVDITSKFMDTFDFGRFQQLQQISVIGYIPDPKIMVRQYFGSDAAAEDSEFTIGHNGEVLVRVRTLFKYNIQTVSGDCGAVLVAFDKNFSNKIFGIHCAGLNDPHYQGYGTPVTRNFLNYLCENIECVNAEAKMHPALPVHSEALTLEVNTCMNGRNMWMYQPAFEGNFYPIGRDAKRLFQSGDTKIVPSPVHGVIQTPTMAPALLRPKIINGQRVDPMTKARVKASPISPIINQDDLDEATYHFAQKIRGGENDKIILTYEQSIAGIEGDDCYPAMKRSTSPGYGWSKKGKGKTFWLGEDEYDFTNQELHDKYDELLQLCKEGRRPNTVWCDTLKDERRNLDKVEEGKTRLFSCGEMAFTMLFRQYFSGFIAHMTRNKIDFESCVGTNVYSLDWTKIVRTLHQVGRKVLAGDFANYDGTLHPDILWKVLELINAWYNDGSQNAMIRTAIWSEIVNSIHLVEDIFYMWNHSQPSGCPMTTILNCVYHSIAARYVYIVCARRACLSLIGLENFDRYVRHVNYGDDDCWCISDEIIDWFNQISITEAFLALGMKYTDEAKTGNIVAFRTLDEINFLKREFRWDPVQCRYRAPLALSTIREMAMWNHGTVDQYPLTATILEDAVRELAQHDESTFRQEFPAFERAADVIRKRTRVSFKTYKQYQLEEAIKIMT